MRKKMRLSLNRSGGFSLAEMLMAMMILLMASGILAGGVPAAAQVYWKIIDTANAQTLLSTTMISLRDELDTASHITLNENSEIIYTNDDGSRLKITPNYSSKEPGLYLEYLSSEFSEMNGNLPAPRLLVSNAAANQNLLVEYGTPSITKGVVVFPKLLVKKWKIEEDKTVISPDVLASVENYKIRILWPS